jgi:predicted transcriptional regulator
VTGRMKLLDAPQALADVLSRLPPVCAPTDTLAGQRSYLRRLGLNVRVLRTAQELSQEELAALAGMDRTYVSRVERGQHNVTVLVVARLAQALGVTSAQLLP